MCKLMNMLVLVCKIYPIIYVITIMETQAYDFVLRPELWSKLRKMGLGGSFVGIIQVRIRSFVLWCNIRRFVRLLINNCCAQALYDGDKVIADVNGEYSRDIYLQRGLRQGCSMR